MATVLCQSLKKGHPLYPGKCFPVFTINSELLLFPFRDDGSTCKLVRGPILLSFFYISYRIEAKGFINVIFV